MTHPNFATCGKVVSVCMDGDLSERDSVHTIWIKFEHNSVQITHRYAKGSSSWFEEKEQHYSNSYRASLETSLMSGWGIRTFREEFNEEDGEAFLGRGKWTFKFFSGSPHTIISRNDRDDVYNSFSVRLYWESDRPCNQP